MTLEMSGWVLTAASTLTRWERSCIAYGSIPDLGTKVTFNISSAPGSSARYLTHCTKSVCMREVPLVWEKRQVPSQAKACLMESLLVHLTVLMLLLPAGSIDRS